MDAMDSKGAKTKGLIFDLEEFAVYDGPGIRSTVFLKGCPLCCNWCHNPEGLHMRPERYVSYDLCAHCGACERVCPTKGHCTACGQCVAVCPRQCIRIMGQWVTAEEIAERIGRNALILQKSGGVTFSGGEALMQPDFVLAVRALLPNLHAAVETCGHVPSADFVRVVEAMDLVMMDVKHTDSARHKQYTGVGNEQIHQNLMTLKAMGKPFIARVPVIPGVNDDEANLRETARWLSGASGLVRVELLAYNRAAGAKYRGLGARYAPQFDETQMPALKPEIFQNLGMECVVL